MSTIVAKSKAGKLAGAISQRIRSDNLVQIEMVRIRQFAACLSASLAVHALPLRPDWSRSGVYRNQVRHHRRGVCQTGWMDRSFLAKVRACSSSDSYGFPAFQRSNVQLSRSDFFSLDAQDIEDKVLAVRQELVWLLSRIWYS